MVLPSSADTFLEPAEISGLTRKVRRPAQRKQLHAMGITHIVRAPGSIAILRAHITKVFRGDPDSKNRAAKAPSGPNWDAI